MADRNIGDTTHRNSDVGEEPCVLLAPIVGFNAEPLVSLEEATYPLKETVPRLDTCVYVVKDRAKNPADGLTVDESAAIALYTMEWNPYTDSLYYILNKALRTEDRESLKPWNLYLKLLLTALDKVPTVQMTVYRGVKFEMLREYSRYQEGNEIVWWGFSSCSVSRNISERDQFLGKTGRRNLFAIDCINGKDIEKHSYFRREKEVLLQPATNLEVVRCEDQGNGLHVIYMQEIPPKHVLIDPVSRASATKGKVAKPAKPVKAAKNELIKIINQCKMNGAAYLIGPLFHDSDIEMILQQLLVTKRCRKLFFRENQLSPVGTQILADAVRQNTTLEQLYISNYNLGTEGVRILAEALSAGNNKTIKQLCLGSNKIHDGGAIHLATMLEGNRTITHLYLSANDVSDQGFQRLMEVLCTTNKTLQSLSLEWNQFGNDESLQSAMAMLTNNKTLLELNLESCKFSRPAVKQLQAFTKGKKHLRLSISAGR